MTIATEYIFVVEGEQKWWKCGNSTKVIGLGIGEFIHIYGEADSLEYESVEDYVDLGEECFANHCDCCGALQGNWFLFGEPDSPLSSCVEGNELIERMNKLKMFEELILSTEQGNEYVSYEELYG